MAEQLNNIMLFDKDNAKMQLPNTSDTLRWNLDTTIGGNLTVTGTTTSVHSESVLIKDNFLDLNSSYTTASAQQGGLTVNYSPTSTSSASASFTAGSGAGPKVTVSSASGFAVDDVIQISDATDVGNDGLYIIQGISGSDLTVYGTGGTGVPAVHSWAKNQFTTNASDTAATVCKVAVSIMKVDTSGDWQVGKGSNIGSISYSAIQTGSDSSDTLQAAYEAGNTITTDGSNGALTFAGNQLIHSSSSAGFRVSSGALDIDSSLDADVSTWDVDASAAITLDAGAGSHLKTSAGDLDIQAAANLDLDGATVNIDSAAALTAAGTVSTLNGTTALVLSNGSANMQIASGALTDGSMASYAFSPSGAFNVTSGASSTINVTGTLALVGSAGHSVVSTGGTYTLNSAGQLYDLDAGTLDIDSSGATDILAGSTVSVKGATGASFGDDTATWEFDGSGAVSETGMTSLSMTPSGAVTISGGAASSYSTSSGALTLDGAGGVSIAGNAAEIDITTSGTLDANVGVLDIDSSGTVDIDGTVSTINGSTAVVVKNGSAAIQMASGVVSDSSVTSYSFSPSAAYDITAGAASTIQTSAGALALVGAGGINMVSTGANMSVNAAGRTIDTDCTTFDLDATTLALTASSGGFALDSTAASRVGVTGANLNLKTTTSGNIEVEAAGYVHNKSFIAMNGDNPATDSGAKVGIRMIAGENIGANDVVYIKQGGLFKADASSMASAFATGAAPAAINSGSWGNVAALCGSFVDPVFDSAPNTTSDLGKRVYLSETAGKVTLTPPTTSGAVQYQVGHLAYSASATTGNLITWAPQFLIEVP